MSIRESLESQERLILSPYAQLSCESRGRERPEPLCSIRPIYQHDRDRIVHCKAFRRLKGKTQVFLAPEGDHYRTRLTHTLEVTQVARTIARALRLNEYLTEAIGMGHDLGHTPFGHAGEKVLNELMPGGFHHAAQSLRVVQALERDGAGLNLSREVLDGIRHHTKGKGQVLSGDERLTLEAQVVRVADIVAYVNHDLDDAIRARVLRLDDLPVDILEVLGRTHGERLDRLISDIVRTSNEDGGRSIRMSRPVHDALVGLRDFLYEHVYDSPAVHGDFIKAEKLMVEVWNFFLEDPARIRTLFGAPVHEDEPVERTVCDLIAGMTDRYVIKLYQDIFLPKPWMVL